jgi:hypothetical protein
MPTEILLFCPECENKLMIKFVKEGKKSNKKKKGKTFAICSCGYETLLTRSSLKKLSQRPFRKKTKRFIFLL